MDSAAHKRIDYGVKRGKRLPQRRNSNPVEPSTGQFIPLLPRDDESIRNAIADYANGATLQQIANKYGVSKEAIYGWLLGDLGGAEHAMLVTQALTARIADADQMLDSSDTPLNLARAREQARFRRMDLERRRPALYGQKVEVNQQVAPILNIQIISASPVTVVSAQQNPDVALLPPVLPVPITPYGA